MLNLPIRYQFVLFGQFDDIQANTGTLQAIQALLNKSNKLNLIPMVFQEMEIVDGRPLAKSRLRLKSPDEIWEISFQKSRVDFIKVNQHDDPNQIGSVKDFYAPVLELINDLELIRSKKYFRLALVTDYIDERSENSKNSDNFNNHFKSIDFHIKNTPYEWSSKISSEEIIPIRDNSEKVNVIVNFGYSKVEYSSNTKDKEISDRLFIKIDINTSHLNNEYRFEINDIDSFMQSALKTEEQLLNEYWKHYGN